MQIYEYQDKKLFMSGVDLTSLAQEYGTPLYVYSADKIRDNYAKCAMALTANDFKPNIFYAVKANSNLTILKLLGELGAGFDIVSTGELQRIIAAGCQTDKVIFSGVGKTFADLEFALSQNIKCINIESFAEIARLEEVCQKLNTKADVAVRLNPNIDAKTHPYISTGLKENKFGIDIDFTDSLIEHLKQAPSLNLVGLAFHLGSQITEKSPFLEALKVLEPIIDKFNSQGFKVEHLDLGGGYAINYKDEEYFDFTGFLQAIPKSLRKKIGEFFIAPGRSLVGDAGVLLAKIEYLKKTEIKNFAILDTSMNDLIRPTLYSAWHKVQEVNLNTQTPSNKYELVGSVCETGDFLAKSRVLHLAQGDFLAIQAAGAYGFSMASNYNSRLLPAEILIDKQQVKLIRRRQTFADLYALEQGL